MDRPYHFIVVEPSPPVFCVRLRQQSYNDQELDDLGAEIGRLVDEEGCRKLVLTLGPEDPECLFSVFLAKLVNLQKRLENDGGTLVLAQLSETTRGMFHAAGLERFFRFYPDAASARQALQSP